MSLALQQQALLARLFEPRGGLPCLPGMSPLASNNVADFGLFDSGFASNHRGFLAYQANGLELAHRTLAGTYPVMQQLIGDESFAALAAALWQAHPPVRGDLAHWGGELAEFVRHSEQLADEPYLPDLARAEWVLQQFKTAPDETADLASLQQLISGDPSVINLCVTHTAQGLDSPWPLASLWLVHQPAAYDASLENKPGFEQVGVQIRQRVAQTALMWRDGHRPRLREALPGEVTFIAALQQGQSLDQALRDTPLDFSAWLPLAAQSGLLLGAVALSV